MPKSYICPRCIEKRDSLNLNFFELYESESEKFCNNKCCNKKIFQIYNWCNQCSYLHKICKSCGFDIKKIKVWPWISYET